MKNIKLVFILVLIMILTFLGTISIYANEDGVSNPLGEGSENLTITYTKEFPARDGTIIFNLNGLNFDLDSTYQYSLTNVTSETPEDNTWINLADFDKTTASVKFEGKMSKLNKVLAKSNRGVIWIKKTDSSNDTAIKVSVDLTLAPESVVDLTNASKLVNGKYEVYNGNYVDIKVQQLYTYYFNNVYSTYTGYLNNIGYKFVKVSDEDILDTWLNVKKDESEDLQGVYDLINSKMTIPTSGYSTTTSEYLETAREIPQGEFKRKRDGLYVIYVQYKGEGYKTVYGYLLYDGIYDTGTQVSQYLDPTSSTDNGNSGTTPSSSTEPSVNVPNSTNTEPTTTSTTPSSSTPTTTTTSSNSDDPSIQTIRVGFDSTTTTTQAQKNDATTSNKILPNTGFKYSIIFAGAIALGFGIYSYSKYKKLKLK